MRLLPYAAVLVALALPATAQAAYAPKLEVTVDPATPGVPAALTTTVTQAGGETASKAVRLEIPGAFLPSATARLTPCTDPQKTARACPEDTRMGQAVAQTLLGTFSGTVNYGPIDPQGIRFFVFLSNGVPLLDQTLEGHIEIVGSGYATVLDGLPDLPVTSFRLSLDGGERALLTTPAECGTQIFTAAFTSHRDEHAVSESTVEIAGCPNRAPRIEFLRASAKRRTVRFALNEEASVSVKVRTLGGRVLRWVTTSGGPGSFAIKLPKLRRGRYSVLVTATDADGARTSRKVRYRVRR